MHQAFELRANVTAYDACYVALAEGLDCALCMGDGRLARASGPRCAMLLISRPNEEAWASYARSDASSLSIPITRATRSRSAS